MGALRRLRHLAGFVGREGLVSAARHAAHRVYSDWWDRRLGVDTAGGDFSLAAEGFASDDFHDYSPSSCLDLTRVFRRLRPDPNRDVFLDYGSGLGRVVLMAAAQPFRRVLGVELSPHLVERALTNLEVALPRLACRDVQMQCGNALAYPLPRDVSVVYLYNPFGGDVLRGVVENIRRSFEAAPRRLTVVCATPPRFEQAVATQRWLRPLSEFRGLRRHVLYEAVPGEAAPYRPNTTTRRDADASFVSSLTK
jgi:SAM-dependent methyltransferase